MTAHREQLRIAQNTAKGIADTCSRRATAARAELAAATDNAPEEGQG